METVLVRLSWNSLKKIIPEEYLQKSGMTSKNYSKALVFSAQEGEISFGMCIFFPYNGSSKVYNLVYVLVEETRQRKQIAYNLINDSKKQLSLADIQTIVTSFYDEDENEIRPVLEKLGFSQVATNYMMAYSVETLMKSKVGKEMEKLKKQLHQVKSYAKTDESLINKLFAEIRAKDPGINLANLNRNLTEFYIQDDKACGYLGADIIDKNKIHIRDVYLTQNTSPKAIPLMFTKLIQTVAKKHPKDMLIGMEFENEKMGEAILATFGDSDEIEKLPMMRLNLDL